MRAPFNGPMVTQLLVFIPFLFLFFCSSHHIGFVEYCCSFEFFFHFSLSLNLYAGDVFWPPCFELSFPFCSIDGVDTPMLSRQVALAGKWKHRRGLGVRCMRTIGPGWQTELKGLGGGGCHRTKSGVFWVLESLSLVVWQRRVWTWAHAGVGFSGVHMPKGLLCDVPVFLWFSSWSIRSDETSNKSNSYLKPR
ncbi:hypothetical protein CH063_08786 [Colletotrichum higginsianum]|uniref:Secreted protein n=1 Tax=Colletotrichum higginsianum (strain IMI 349063) TaxID=759273 RepID=H1VB63_COLHI|nr:hypothetical protein CH063_08786 [Colletotrichum higginsianum]